MARKRISGFRAGDVVQGNIVRGVASAWHEYERSRSDVALAVMNQSVDLYQDYLVDRGRLSG